MNLAETIKSMGQPQELEEQTMEPNGNPEDNMPASPDEKRMAMKQADFIQYVGREIAEYLAANKEFPEWMQNKLSAFHQKAKDMHSTLGGRYDNMDEEVDMDALHKAIKKKLSDEGGAAGFAPLKDVAKKMGVDLTPEMLKGMDDIEQHKDGDYILDDDDDDDDEMNEELEGVFTIDEAKSKEQQIADLEKMLDRISGNTSSVKMKKFAIQRKIDKLKNEEVELDEEMDLINKIVMGVAVSSLYLPAVMMMVSVMLDDAKKDNLDDKNVKTVKDMTSKFKKNKNYKPTRAEMDDAKELANEIKTKKPSIFKRAMAKVSQLKSKKEALDEAKRDPSKSGGSGYDLYHKDFSSAMKHAYDYAKNKLGVEIDPKEIDDKVASGPRKPSKGKTNTYRLKGKDGKKAVQIQVHGMDSGKYELNMYKESVELDEAMTTAIALTPSTDKNYKTAVGIIQKYRSQGVEAEPEKKGNSYEIVVDGPVSAMRKLEKEMKQSGIKFMATESVELDEAMRTLEFEGNAKNKNLQNLAKKHGVKLSQKGKMVIAKGDREAIDTMEIELDLVESVEINEAFESEFKTDRYGNTNSFLDAIMGVVSEKVDPVNKKALKKNFDDRKDKDLDNDGDVDDSDEYLHKRRKAVSKAMKSEDDAETAEKDQEKEISDKEDESKKKKVGKSEKQTKVDVNPSIEEEKGEKMTSAEMEKRDEIMKSLEKRKDDFVKKYGDRAKEVMARTAIKMAKKHA